MVLRDKAKRYAFAALWPLFPAHREVRYANYKASLESFWRWVAGPDLAEPEESSNMPSAADKGKVGLGKRSKGLGGGEVRVEGAQGQEVMEQE